MVEAEYRKGMADGLKNWGQVCSGQGRCDECPVGVSKGQMSCQEFAYKFPEMMANVLEQAASGHVNSYYNEFCVRFPNSAMPVELLARAFCRKAMFEGSFECTVEDDVDACIACWNKPHYSDVEQEQEVGSKLIEPGDITF